MVRSPWTASAPIRLGLALEEVAAAGEHRDVRALGGERLGDRETHARRRAADDRRAPLSPRSIARKASRAVVQRP